MVERLCCASSLYEALVRTCKQHTRTARAPNTPAARTPTAIKRFRSPSPLTEVPPNAAPEPELIEVLGVSAEIPTEVTDFTRMRSLVREREDCERTRKITTARTPSTTRAAMVVRIAESIKQPNLSGIRRRLIPSTHHLLAAQKASVS